MITVKDSVIRRHTPLYAVGYDLRDDQCQISFLREDGTEPETVPVVEGTESYDIPTLLLKRTGTGSWSYGREASRNAAEGILVDSLVSKAERGEEVPVGEESYDPVSLLALFVKRSLSLLAPYVPPERIGVFYFTTENLSPRLVEVLGRVAASLNLSSAMITYESHVESFYRYMLHQEPELLTGDAYLFEMKKSLKSMRFFVNQRTMPKVCMVETEDYPSFSRDDLPEDEGLRSIEADALDRKFLTLSNDCLKDKDVRSVFLVGDGFGGDWMKDSLRALCRRRRVFQGSNLFSKGACYSANDRLTEKEEDAGQKEYVYLGDEMLKANIGLRACDRGKETYFAILDAGENWFEARRDFRMILTEGKEVEFIVTPMTGNGVKKRTISLDGLPERERNTTKLFFHLEMSDPQTLNIEIEDLGFGEIVKPSGLAWSHSMDIR